MYIRKYLPNPEKSFHLGRRPTVPELGALRNLEVMAIASWGISIRDGKPYPDARVWGDDGAGMFGLPDFRHNSESNITRRDLEVEMFCNNLFAAQGFIGATKGRVK